MTFAEWRILFYRTLQVWPRLVQRGEPAQRAWRQSQYKNSQRLHMKCPRFAMEALRISLLGGSMNFASARSAVSCALSRLT
jgi:hypothetical protein